ncbi:unnamed protein product, partial [Didymodactylos carnosus]
KGRHHAHAGHSSLFRGRRGPLQDAFQPPVPYDNCCIRRSIQARYSHAGVDINCTPASVGVVAMGDGDVVEACDGQVVGGAYTCAQGGKVDIHQLYRVKKISRVLGQILYKNIMLKSNIVSDKPLYVFYFHLAHGSVAVQGGTRVKKGTQVGMIGTTGLSTGLRFYVTAQTNPGPADGLYDPTSIVDFRTFLEMDNWKAC